MAITRTRLAELIDEVNKFLSKFESKDVYDIKYQDVPSGPDNVGGYSAMIIFEEVKL
jgi:Protein of unknown function (DUF2758).